MYKGMKFYHDKNFWRLIGLIAGLVALAALSYWIIYV